MALTSKNEAAGRRFRVELWSWATWLVLCVISYPAVVVVWTAPRAGLVGGLAVGTALLFAASLGYSGRRELEGWLWPAVSSLTSGAVVVALAFAGDRTSLGSAVLCGLAVAGEMLFVWHFLPWIARDADPSPARGEAVLQLFRTGARSAVRIRPALALVLLLAFLSLGLGAAWSRGERDIPAPTGWLFALALVTFGLMFVERISFFERSAREGNLLLPAGSYRKWIGAGLVLLLFAAVVATIIPREPSPKATGAGRPGRAVVEMPAPATPQQPGLREAAGEAITTVRQLAAAALALPPLLLVLWLLLLLLLLALILVWGFRRSRAAKWILRLLGWTFSFAVRAWRRLAAAIRRLLMVRGRGTPTETAPDGKRAGDPFLDPFEDPEAVLGLSPREIVIRTYHLLLNFAEMLGHGRSRGQTPFEYANLLQQAAPKTGGSLTALTWAYAGAMYGGDHFAPPEPDAVRRAWEQISQALTEGISPEDLALRRRAYLATRALERSR
jgi:hypothetical protein